MRCPACGGQGCLRRHGGYHKYYFHRQIAIVRVRCQVCRRTHALIPSFSLPGLSVGCAEVERYLAAREGGQGRGCAAAELVSRGVSEAYPRHLERMFTTRITRGKALLVGHGQPTLQGLAWVRSVVGEVEHPLLELNRFALARAVNGILFCRVSILLFAGARGMKSASHRIGSAQEQSAALTCGP